MERDWIQVFELRNHHSQARGLLAISGDRALAVSGDWFDPDEDLHLHLNGTALSLIIGNVLRDGAELIVEQREERMSLLSRSWLDGPALVVGHPGDQAYLIVHLDGVPLTRIIALRAFGHRCSLRMVGETADPQPR
jgi:hypothetical protein